MNHIPRASSNPSRSAVGERSQEVSTSTSWGVASSQFVRRYSSWYWMRLKNTVRGAWENNQSTGRNGTTAPAVKLKRLPRRLSAGAWRRIQTGRTGAAVAVKREDAAAEPASKPATPVNGRVRRSTATTATRNADTSKNRRSEERRVG